MKSFEIGPSTVPDNVRTPDQITWLLVAGGFHQRGGMDKANYALAQFLSESGRPVHLVTHDVDNPLRGMPGVSVTVVKRPANSVFLGEFALDRAVRIARQRLQAEGHRVRTVANGSSCLIGDVNWVHYVHSAWRPRRQELSVPFRVRSAVQQQVACSRERIAFERAKLILTNSNLTAEHVAACLKGDRRKLKTVYLGADPLVPTGDGDREQARRRWDLPSSALVAAFVGGFGLDSRKGFDVLLKAWRVLSSRVGWDVHLLVAGDGPALARYRREAERSEASKSIRFLGFCREIDAVLAASDLLISPVRYEPYGLNVQEALSSGLAVLTSANAGIAERFTAELSPLLIRDPNSVEECVEKIRCWRADKKRWAARFRRLGDELRGRTWQAMSRDIVNLVDAELSHRLAN